MRKSLLSSSVLTAAVVLFAMTRSSEARADDATVTVGNVEDFSEPPQPQPQPMIVPQDGNRFQANHDLIATDPELPRSPFRMALGPTGITTGNGFGFGVGIGADIGTGSVGGRLSAAWLRGEGANGNGSSTPTGDSIGLYSGELTLDLHKKGPIHPVIGMGAGFLHVSRPDNNSGWAGMGTGRFAVEYALGLDDADVRVGANVTGGVIGPVDTEIKSLHAYATTGLQLAIGF